MLSVKPRGQLCWNHSPDELPVWAPSNPNQGWWPKLSRYPDTQQLKPGDLLLFRPLKPNVVQEAIIAHQGDGDTAAFTHAAIYLGNDHEICEASAAERKVVISSLEDKLTDACLLARRLQDHDDERGLVLASVAAFCRNDPYCFKTVFSKVLKRAPQKPALENAWVCSTLYEHAALSATKGRICFRPDHDPYYAVTPSDLAGSVHLVDVALRWNRVAHRSFASGS